MSGLMMHDSRGEYYRETIVDLVEIAKSVLIRSPSRALGGRGSSGVYSAHDLDIARAANRAISLRHPNDGIVIEDAVAVREQADIQWVVDPVDGSLNHSRNLPEFAFGVAVLVHGEPVLSGFWCASIDIAIYSWSLPALTDRSRAQDEVRIVATGLSGVSELALDECERIRRVISQGHAVREYGSCIEGMGRLAIGAIDGYWEFNLAVWDVAPAVPVLRAAGIDVWYNCSIDHRNRNCWVIAEWPKAQLGLTKLVDLND